MADWARIESDTGFQVDCLVGVVLLTELGVGNRAKLAQVAGVQCGVPLPGRKWRMGSGPNL